MSMYYCVVGQDVSPCYANISWFYFFMGGGGGEASTIQLHHNCMILKILVQSHFYW